jgi:hypothetical protein
MTCKPGACEISRTGGQARGNQWDLPNFRRSRRAPSGDALAVTRPPRRRSHEVTSVRAADRPDERAVTVTYDADAPLEESRHVEPWLPVLDRLQIEAATTR